MADGTERIERIAATLKEQNLDALVCTFPEDVLLVTGYWPVVGTSVAVATPDGRITCLVPQDEMELAALGWATDLRPYSPGSLETLITPVEAAREPFATLLGDLGVAVGRIAYEDLAFYEGASYAAMHLFNTAITGLLHAAAPGAALVSGSPAISQLRSRLTAYEVDRVRLACHIAGPTFIQQTKTVRLSAHEPEIAAAYAGSLLIDGLSNPSVTRSNAFVWCMSGPRSAEAGAAYARTANRQLQPGDLVLIHCNSYVDGYWTDITRTYCLGEPDDRQRAMYDAIFTARAAALNAIKPGARAVDVDAAARHVLTERGFGKYFTHGIGHSVGFSVISADFPPRLHPNSPDILGIGSTFNIEPAIYIKGYGGIRHCDVVTVREDGPEVLTPFQESVEELALPD